MKITVEHIMCDDDGNEYPRKFTLETSDDLTVDGMMEEFKILLIAMTYHSESIQRYFEVNNE